MDEFEQRVALKFLFLKGLRYRAAHAELSTVLGEDCYSLSAVKFWLRRFKSGDFSCQDAERPGRPVSDLSDSIQAYLTKFPFSSAKSMAKYFHTSVTTVTNILHNSLGLKKFARRWVPHDLTRAQKHERVSCSREILDVLEQDEVFEFQHIATGDESWFFHRYQHTHCYAKSREEVPTRVSTTIGMKKSMVTIFFTGKALVCLDVLERGFKFNQEYFRDIIGPDLVAEHRRALKRKTKYLLSYTWITRPFTTGRSCPSFSLRKTSNVYLTRLTRRTLRPRTFGFSDMQRKH